MERQLAHKLPLLTRAWRQLADAMVVEFRLSSSSAWCLIYLDRLGPEVRQTDLAETIGITAPSTVRIIDQLVVAGFVTRTQDPDDKRANRILLTESGRELVGTIEARLVELRRELFDGLPDRDLDTMLRVTDILSARIADRRS